MTINYSSLKIDSEIKLTGKADVKKEFKSLNVTPFQYPALFFADVAVSVNDKYQFFFAPDIKMINFHCVTEFTRRPVLNQVY